jgi:hypothetical protein
VGANDAKAKRQLILLLKGCLPARQFDIALTLVHGVCVPGNKAIGKSNNGSDSAAARGSNNGDGSDSATSNNKRTIDNTPAGLQVAIKKRCLDRAQAPPAETTWVVSKPTSAVSTWARASWGTPAPKVTPAEPRFFAKITLPAHQSISAPQPPPTHSHGNHYQNGNSPTFCDNGYQQRGRSPHHNNHFQRHHSPHHNNILPPHHSPNRNQHHHHAPNRNHSFQRHQSSHYTNSKRF